MKVYAGCFNLGTRRYAEEFEVTAWTTDSFWTQRYAEESDSHRTQRHTEFFFSRQMPTTDSFGHRGRREAQRTQSFSFHGICRLVVGSSRFFIARTTYYRLPTLFGHRGRREAQRTQSFSFQGICRLVVGSSRFFIARTTYYRLPTLFGHRGRREAQRTQSFSFHGISRLVVPGSSQHGLLTTDYLLTIHPAILIAIGNL